MSKRKKKRNRNIFIGVGVISLIVLILFFTIPQIQFGDQPYFEAPFFGTIECKAAPGGAINSNPINPRSTGQWIECPENSISCNVAITYPELEGFVTLQRRAEYYACDNKNFLNCETSKFTSSNLEDGTGSTKLNIYSSLPSNKVLYLEFQKRTLTLGWESDDQNVGRAILTFVPYILWNQNSLEGGLNTISGSTDCIIPTSSQTWTQRIISSDIGSPKIALTNKLSPGDVYNYVAGTVTRANFGNAISYNGQNAYCAENIQGREAVIYGISQVQTASTTYNIVDFSKELTSNIDCCVENRVQLNRVCKDFKWETIQVDEETGESNVKCSITNPCNPGKFILDVSDKTSFENKCIEGQCVVSNIKTEECVVNADCGNNEVCTNFECIMASTIPGETDEIEGDIDEEECTILAERQPLLGWTWVSTSEEVGKGPLGIGKIFGLTNTVTTGECKASFVKYYVLGGIILILGGIIIFVVNKRIPKKKKK